MAFGFEPSPTYSLAKNYSSAVVFNDYFYPHRTYPRLPQINFFILRHVIEHLADPFTYIKNLNDHYDTSTNRKALYLEAPDAAFLIMNHLYFDFYADHPFYFTENFLGNFLRGTGWVDICRLDMKNREFLCILSSGRNDDVYIGAVQPEAPLLHVTRTFLRDYQSRKDTLRQTLQTIKDRGNRIGAWGITLLASLGAAHDFFSYVIDSDHNKQNRYIPISGTPIVPADILEREPVDYLIVTSYTFVNEISELIRARYGNIVKIINPYGMLQKRDY